MRPKTKAEKIDAIISEIRAELTLNIGRFSEWPEDIIHAQSIVTEKVSGLSKKSLQSVYEPEEATQKDAEKEAILTVVAAIRFLMESDKYKTKPRHQQRFHSNQRRET